MASLNSQFLAEAIRLLNPHSEWHLSLGGTISDIEWINSDEQTPPSTDDIQTKYDEIANDDKNNTDITTAAGKLNALRDIRNAKLAETDWWATSDRTMTAEQIAYRQALRDLTNTVSSLDMEENVVWPTKPE